MSKHFYRKYRKALRKIKAYREMITELDNNIERQAIIISAKQREIERLEVELGREICLASASGFVEKGAEQ